MLLLSRHMLSLIRLRPCPPSIPVQFVTVVHGLTLHVKAGPDGQSIGDCPFAHAVRIVAGAKGLGMNIEPHAPGDKPSWLIENHEGKMPALVDQLTVITESRTIADYLETRYPQPPLAGLPRLTEAEAAAKPVFGAFARFCKSANGSEDERELRKELLRCLCTLDAHLASSAAPYACGEAISMADAFILPVLYHIEIAGGALKSFSIPEQFTALRTYIDSAFATPLLRECTPERAMVVWGWANARGDEEALQAAAAELA
jgi:RNA polymerase-associated protein